MTCKPSEGYRKGQLTATSIMFPCSHHACICIAVLSSWTSGLRCKGNWHKNKKSFQQTCISMNEMITCCFSKNQRNHATRVHFLWQCESNENVNSCNIIKHLRSRTCKSRHSTQVLLAMRVTFSSLSLRTPQPKKVKLNFSKTMFANEIVSFTISSISKSPTMASFCNHLSKTSSAKKNQTISDIPVLFPPKFDKHTFDKQRLRKKIPNRYFVRSIFTNNKQTKHTHVVKHGCTCLFFASFPLAISGLSGLSGLQF